MTSLLPKSLMRKSPELLAVHYTKENSRERGVKKKTKATYVNSHRVASQSTTDMKKEKDMSTNERLSDKLTIALLFHVEKKVPLSNKSPFM